MEPADNQFCDTRIICKDGVVLGERSFLGRISKKFADQLQKRNGEMYEIQLPDEEKEIVEIFYHVVVDNAENNGLLYGPAQELLEMGLFIDLKPENVVRFTSFCLRNGACGMLDPIFVEGSPIGEALEPLMELVLKYKNELEGSENILRDICSGMFGIFLNSQLYPGKATIPVYKLTTYAYLWPHLVNLYPVKGKGRKQSRQVQEGFLQSFLKANLHSDSLFRANADLSFVHPRVRTALAEKLTAEELTGTLNAAIEKILFKD